MPTVYDVFGAMPLRADIEASRQEATSVLGASILPVGSQPITKQSLDNKCAKSWNSLKGTAYCLLHIIPYWYQIKPYMSITLPLLLSLLGLKSYRYLHGPGLNDI